ncbi:MAG: secA, partial [Candidatus Saccharibacteria bacterium]|nr:secA [Candidatus Saccharibacteria bacterium]
DFLAVAEEDHQTELTRLAESAVERGVNEITSGEQNRDNDFNVEKKLKNENKIKNDARKKKKAQRQNRKKSRK